MMNKISLSANAKIYLAPLIKYIINYYGTKDLLFSMIIYFKENNPMKEQYIYDLESGLMGVLEKYEDRYLDED